MPHLLDAAIYAHGGLDRWKALSEIRFMATSTGTLAGARDALVNSPVTVDTRSQRCAFESFGTQDHRIAYMPDRMETYDAQGVLLAEHWSPQNTFKPNKPWREFQAAYFLGYSLWNYANIPYLFTWDGFEVAEIEPWEERGEVWRRLRVTFPEYVTTHSPVQTFYFGADDCLLRRQDYQVSVSTGRPVAHYLSDYVVLDGFHFATRRRVVPRRSDGSTEAEPFFVSLEFHSLRLL
jgi:hypothetical protein